MNPTQVALYARVSTDQQTEAQTVASQVAALRERVATDTCAQIGDFSERREPGRPVPRDRVAGRLFERLACEVHAARVRELVARAMA